MAFGTKVIAYDPYVQPGRAAQLGISLVDLDTLLAESDFITVHLPKTPETVGLIGAVLVMLTLLLSIGVKPLREIVPPRREKPIRETVAYRWSRIVQARPWTWVALSAGVLLVLTAPVLSLRLGFSDEGNFSPETTTRQAYDLVAEGFGPGYNGPFLLAATTDDPSDAAAIQQLAVAIGADPGVASVSPPFPNDLENPEASEAFILRIIPTTSPQDEVTEATVQRLRDVVIPAVVDGTGVQASQLHQTESGAITRP